MCRNCRCQYSKDKMGSKHNITEGEAEESEIEDVLEDLAAQALTSDRTNQMSKTYTDLDAILQLLHEKEKDLELSAKIGQSLLQRNKQLLDKTQVLEDYVKENNEKETQLQHEVSMKSDLLQKYLKESEYDELCNNSTRSNHTDTDDSRSNSDGSCRDYSLSTLQYKCNELEEQNCQLILEALHLKEETQVVEQREQMLVNDCINQLAEAKDQISNLTDEISQKAEDNIRQQEEITHLITTVVELQQRHRQLMVDNEELQNSLSESTENQNQLKVQVHDLHEKYQECFEMLLENQKEMKSLSKKIDTDPHPTLTPPRGLGHYGDSVSSLAGEIEESVKRDLTNSQERKLHTSRVMETVKVANTRQKANKTSRRAHLPQPRHSTPVGFNFTPPPSRIEPNSGPQDVTDQINPKVSYGRRSFRAPEKLQIVKPIKGSATLHKWKKLATPNLKLTDTQPGVHVKGEVTAQGDQSNSRQGQGIHGNDDPEEDDDEPIMMRARPKSSESIDIPSSSAEGGVVPKSVDIPSGGAEGGIVPQGDNPFKTSSILASLLNNPSRSSPTKGSVGQVLAEALDKASKQSTNRKRAESLANLSKYFSDKERSGSITSFEAVTIPVTSPVTSPLTSPVITPSLPKVFPNPVVTPVGSGLLSKVLRSSNLGLALTQSPPVTTSANTTSLMTMTSSTPGGLVRNSSGDNLLRYFQKQPNSSSVEKRRSLDSSELMNTSKMEQLRGLSVDTNAVSMPTLMRRASSGDLSSMDKPSISEPAAISGSRLFRSSSSGNIRDLANGNDLSTNPNSTSETSFGFFGRLRRTSIGSLTDLVKSSDLTADPVAYGNLRRAPSLDSSEVFHSGHSPPSPTRFEGAGAFGLLGNNSSAAETHTEPKQGFFSGSRLSSLAGVRTLWSSRAGPSGMGPSTVSSGSSPTRTLANPGTAPERIETINRALAFEDFGGLGLMSFFGGKKSN